MCGAKASVVTSFFLILLAFCQASLGATTAEEHHKAILEALTNSSASYDQGQYQQAHDTALNAWLEHFEPIEAALEARDPKLRAAIEDTLEEFRDLASTPDNAGALAERSKKIATLLAQTTTGSTNNSNSWSPLASASSAFVILLREGFEAILIVGALLAFLRKTEQTAATRHIHFGWLAALGLGALTWLSAGTLFSWSGANREATEGLTALIAAAMLLYVGFWLHRNSHADRWRSYLKAKLSNALEQRSIWPLVAVSFLAVYREVFETILFYEALWLQTANEAKIYFIFGVLAAVLSLVVLAWLVLRLSVRLPLGIFFKANAALVFIIAVVFVGKGISALEEAGMIAESPVNFPSVPLLGIHGDMQSLLAQTALVVVAAAFAIYVHYNQKPRD